ncbi:hypothetical protein [Neisseria wadsworthii]|uniref:hypothetical protein n=1 Tax=Neisseria wadsworthii TaxID=607711 RepID=UPI0015F5B04E|nr:hypothetical protein [Neisseria wadsworthii]QMT34812.1 hypothetical protein H3L96_06920 [Neisseria wadsworthii]
MWLALFALFAVLAATGAAGADDYKLISPQPADDTAARLVQMDAAARAAEIEVLRQYENVDFDWVKGVVYEPVEDAASGG